LMEPSANPGRFNVERGRSVRGCELCEADAILLGRQKSTIKVADLYDSLQPLERSEERQKACQLNVERGKRRGQRLRLDRLGRVGEDADGSGSILRPVPIEMGMGAKVAIITRGIGRADGVPDAEDDRPHHREPERAHAPAEEWRAFVGRAAARESKISDGEQLDSKEHAP
jgi:hypothetical protein